MTIPQFDPTHNILVFSSFQDFMDFSDGLNDYQNEYPYDQGNNQLIHQKMNAIRTYGFHYGSGNRNQVNIHEFKNLLISSSPLSEDILTSLIDLNDDISGNLDSVYLKDILLENIPFSYYVETAIALAEIPGYTKSSILSANESEYLVPDYAIDDFLGTFPGFNSLYEVLDNQMEIDLVNGMDPGSSSFDDDFIQGDILRAVLNAGKEVYIDGFLFKLYSDCKAVVLQADLASAYSTISLLDSDGFIETPPNVSETEAGLSVSVMDGSFPMEYAVVGPESFGFDVTNATFAIQEIDSYMSNCPQSIFSHDLVGAVGSGVKVHFTSEENTMFDYSTTYYQYWLFGDGTGSFQSDPNHIYASPGVYEVRLTTFNADCGCWDVHTREVYVPELDQNGELRACYADIDFSQVQSPLGTYTFSVNTYDDDYFATPESIKWEMDDGGTEYSGTFAQYSEITHTFGEPGTYDVKVTVTFSNGCEISDTYEAFGVSEVECCEQNTKGFSDLDIEDPTFVAGGKTYKIEIKDKVRNIANIWCFWNPKVVGEQRAFREKSGGGWKAVKIGQEVKHDGQVWSLSAFSRVCETAIDLIGNKVDVAKTVKKEEKINSDFGAKENTIIIEHNASVGVVSWQQTYTYGKCPG